MANPYQLWDTRKSLGVMRDAKVETFYFGQFFTRSIRSEDEYIDFEKLPIKSRRLAPFALPLGRGRGIYDDSAKAYRFKPAYVVLDDAVDPLRPLSYAPGIDSSRFEMGKMSPVQRRELIKAAITSDHLDAIARRMEWLGAKSIIDGKVTLSGPDYPTTLVDFNRAAAHTIVLGAGARWGDAGVSIVDFIQANMDTMNDAEFGGMTTRITMGNLAMGVARKDTEFLAHLDKTVEGGTIRVDRGLVGGANGAKVFKFGEMLVGGNSGQTIELWVNNETYTDDAGVTQRYLGSKEVVFTSTPDAINGYDCFGRIVDQDADYQPLPVFPKNYTTGDRVKVEHISHVSSPLRVPINPNATLKATVLG